MQVMGAAMRALAGSDPVGASLRRRLFDGNMAAWFRQGEGITVTGSGVSQWSDASGNARHLKQSSDPARPALQADRSILFTAANSQRLACDAFTLNQPVTLYLLAKQVAWTNGLVLCDGNSGATMRLVQTVASPGVAMLSGSTIGPINTWAVGTYAVIAGVFSGASSVLQMNTTPTNGNAGTNNPGGFFLGAAPAGAFSDLQVREVIIYSAAHAASMREGIIRYLATKGGLTI